MENNALSFICGQTINNCIRDTMILCPDLPNIYRSTPKRSYSINLTFSMKVESRIYMPILTPHPHPHPAPRTRTRTPHPHPAPAPRTRTPHPSPLPPDPH
ncbi:hypothetical protein QTP88_028627 [Uroleucon formosanum]